MRFRSRITALCALLMLSALLAVAAASARAAAPTARLLPNGQSVAPAFQCAGAAAPGSASTPTREQVFAIIAGLRWDTSYATDGDRTGPGRSEEMRPTGGFRLRHPLDLLAATPLS
jgi:hypothetical protein